MLIKTAIGVLTLLTLFFIACAQGGDNTDARALAGLFYFPAMFFGLIDAILIGLWLVQR